MIPSLLHWTGGYAPLDFGADPPTSAECLECHAEVAREWSKSSHRAAWDNDLFLVGFAAEPLAFCVNCHAPGPDQRAEVWANRSWYRSLDPRSGILPGSVERAPEPLASAGVDCIACHWRGGEVRAGEVSGVAAHAVRAEPTLASGEMCVGCHDFAMPVTVDGVTRPTVVPMQATGAEWRAWRAAGGTESCVDCHLPAGAHTFPGAHDREFLRASLRVEVTDPGLTLSSLGVGHHLPTGDLYRHLTVEVADSDGAWTAVDRIGRSFALEDGQKVLRADTSLRPGVPRAVVIPEGARWRVVWHDGSEQDEVRGLLRLEDLTEVLASGP